MKRLLLKFNDRKHIHVELKLLQTDGCTMGGPLSVILSDIYLTKTEVVKPTNASFYKRSVDDIISKKKKINRTYCLRI